MGKQKKRTRFSRVADTLALTALVCIVGIFAGRMVEKPGAEPMPMGTLPPVAQAVDAQRPALGYTVVVDAGHGGVDGGASGGKTGVAEAGLNLAVACALRDVLEDAGINVTLTRGDEKSLGGNKMEDLRQRKAIMNQGGVDLVVSIHMNHFSDASVSGPMAFYMKGSEEGQALAEKVIANLCDALGRPARKANPGDYYVIRESDPPAVLVECGFLSNPEDEQLLQTEAHQLKLVRGIADGILDYLGVEAGSGASGRDGTAFMERGES